MGAATRHDWYLPRTTSKITATARGVDDGTSRRSTRVRPQHQIYSWPSGFAAGAEYQIEPPSNGDSTCLLPGTGQPGLPGNLESTGGGANQARSARASGTSRWRVASRRNYFRGGEQSGQREVRRRLEELPGRTTELRHRGDRRPRHDHTNGIHMWAAVEKEPAAPRVNSGSQCR